jgi:Zn-dependent protease with chaperone function
MKPASLTFAPIPRDNDPHQIHAILDAVAAKAGWLEPPRLLTGDTPPILIGPRAGSLPKLRTILVFPGFLNLPLHHQVGTMAHEMGHLLAGHQHFVLTKPQATAVACAALSAPFLLGWLGLLLTIAIPAVTWWAIRWQRHLHEEEADTLAVALVGARIVLDTYQEETTPMPWRQSWRRWIRGYPTWRPWLLRLMEDAGLEPVQPQPTTSKGTKAWSFLRRLPWIG